MPTKEGEMSESSKDAEKHVSPSGSPSESSPSAASPEHTPVANPAGPLQAEGMGPHWENLYRNARDTIIWTGENDPALQGILERHFDDMENMPGMSDDETLIYLITRFVDRLTTNIEAITIRTAIMYLARSGWNLDHAVSNFLGEVQGMSESEESVEGSSGLSDPPNDAENPQEPEVSDTQQIYCAERC
jgi:hypothetical protein